MGLFGSNWERDVDNNLFDLIDITQFKNYKFKTLVNYLILWGLVLLHLLLYSVDIYTCIKLLAYNEWSNSYIKPYLTFKISKWLFASCIIGSIILLIYEILKGLKIYKTNNISLIFTNSIAKNLISMQNFNKFCVLNKISPNSGFDKLAFFIYFQIYSFKKLLFFDSPRQIINAMTLFSILNVTNNFNGILTTIKEISINNHNEALILGSMLISLIIWSIFISQFLIALILLIPIYNRILNNLKYKSLRQYVCIKIDLNIKKLNQINQLKHLKKEQNQQINNPNANPKLPKFQSNDNQRVETFTSINSINNQRVETFTSVNSNPFENIINKPQPIHHKQSFQSLESIQSIPISNSLSKYIPKSNYNSNSLNSSTNSLNSLNSLQEKPMVYMDEEKGEIQVNEFSDNDDDDDYDDDQFLDDDMEKVNFERRRQVSQSLILRSHEMESEDYSRFNPLNLKSFIPNQDNNSINSGNGFNYKRKIPK
ncbi:hypothetical protein WICMUC_001490 [Wickerhamomyces mucosus]|uniref:Transmembrane protein n=1 Tax=Wickerhamomyces mucosus TaxID=1378264 RepID=A0A9P8PU99_9ASCO|nr:hypothetical protein WICMUC_001490 [Wickerhamomyces mucosus]